MSWQTINTRSILAHVRLPDAFQIALGLFEHAECKHLQETLIGRPPQKERAWKGNDLVGIEDVHSASRLVDGTYTEVNVTWRDIGFRVRSAVVEGELVLLVEPDMQTMPLRTPLVTVEAAILWNHPGSVERADEQLRLRSGATEVSVYTSARFSKQRVTSLTGAHAVLEMDQALAITTGVRRSAEEARGLLDLARAERDARLNAFGSGDVPDLAATVTSALGWTGVYDPDSGMVATTVSRVWAARNNGCVLFCWDSFFAAMMAQAVGNHDLARTNVEAITRPIDELGYIPNVFNPVGSATFGHSQPPVGSFAVRYIRDASGDADFARPYLDRLLRWNRWWPENRDRDGYLCWGSRREAPRVGGSYETSTGNKGGAKFESGLDNSPMFDDAPYDTESGLMLLADVGLMSIYIRDCQDLAELCASAGREADAAELRERAGTYLGKLETLWCEDTGLYLNRDLTTGEFSKRLSPTLFYPLLTGQVAKEKAERMLREHFYNPDEFWGDYVLPSIARNDPAYSDQSYWRGRVWAPLNFLVYGALRAAGEDTAAHDLAQRGNALILRNWRERGFIGENYNANTGQTGERANSDPFNPWGALLGMIGLMDAGAVPQLRGR